MAIRPVATLKNLRAVLVDRVLLPNISIFPLRPFPALVDGHPAWVTNGASRPRYFDGRFLAARDLDRDQRYFSARLADHFRAAGMGVIHGLDVSAKDDSTLAITPGAAVTSAGSLVVIRDRSPRGEHDHPLELPLFEAADTQRLDQAFGLLRTPRDVPRRRTGIFVLLARPVEYTADPVGLYPASIEERREPEDGDVIEGVALTLAPYHDVAADGALPRQRGELARRIFVERAEVGTAVDAIPLAIVRLERGFIVWVDPWLVRRELGTAHEGIGKFSRGPRALVEAQVQQYHRHLAAIVKARSDESRPAAFSAGEELAALPPAGSFPVAALDLAQQSERFFPQPMPITCQVVPDDEIATILQEHLVMPPIDLSAPDEVLAAMPVALLIPVPRAIVETLPPSLRSFPLRSSAVAPGRKRARSAISLVSVAERFSSVPLADDRASRLATAIGPVTKAYYARLRRSRGAMSAGVVRIERQIV